MKKLKLWYLVITIIGVSFLTIGCNSNTIDNGQDDQQIEADTDNSATEEREIAYKNITPQEARDLLAEDNGVILLDVRTTEEHKEIRIPGSILIPHDNIRNEAVSKLNDKDAIIIVYCRSGRRSKIASLELINMGYKNVYDLGGIIDWPYEVEKEDTR